MNESVDTRRVLDVAIRLGVVALLVFWALWILQPFVHVVIWSAIIACAAYPLFLRLRGVLGGSDKAAAVLFALISIAVLIVPAVALGVGSMGRCVDLAKQWEAGTLAVPTPSDSVKDWPVIGERVYSVWQSASQNLEETAHRFQEPLKKVGAWALRAIAGSGVTLVLFTFSLVIAGVLMAHADACHRVAVALGRRLAGEAGDGFVDLTTRTVRSVAQGVLGIAAIQALLAAVGLVAMRVPLAGVWALGVLVLAIAQLPPLLILGPIAVWSFSAHGTVAATIFAAYCLAVSLSDTVLKPLLLGRGIDVPMLVILLGAIGGMISQGILGLFIGAVILALIYRLLGAWLRGGAAIAGQESLT